MELAGGRRFLLGIDNDYKVNKPLEGMNQDDANSSDFSRYRGTAVPGR